MKEVLTHIDLPSWIPAVLLGTPLFVFISLMLMGRVVNNFRGIYAAILMFGLMLISLYTFAQIWPQNGVFVTEYEWFQLSPNHVIDFNLHIDSISSLFICIVLITAFLVHLFSIEYLRGDRHFEKYFAYLGLFIFAILGVILSQNLFVVFVFWELVGFSSYLLIGFYFRKKTAVFANKKAFLVNRIGDVGFVIGLLTIYSCFGTFNMEELLNIFKAGSSCDFNQAFLAKHQLSSLNLWLIGGGILSGAIAKSAQFPLSVWLPNAMEGPTPVSALIHAATMVAAGVYLIIRTYFLAIPEVLDVIAFVGAITAVMGAFTAMSQTDIKRVLAFSTISQLGYMFMALGVRAADIAMFHLMTHAFFKACLFLGAGAIIHSMYKVEKQLGTPFDPQDMRLMGGLKKSLPLIFIAYVVAAGALVGLPFTSGGLSKEAIISATIEWGATRGGVYYIVPLCALIGTFLTAFYMTRQVTLVFFGESRLAKKLKISEGSFTIPNAPLLMKIPVIVLAVLSVWLIYSFNPIDPHHGWYNHIKVVFEEICAYRYTDPLIIGDKVSLVFIQVLAIGITLFGIANAWLFYGKHNITFGHELRKKTFNPKTFIYKLSYNNWYLDQFYHFMFVSPVLMLSYLSLFVDKVIIEGVLAVAKELMLYVSRISRRVDQNILSRIIDLFAKINVIFATIIGFVDRYIVDGFVSTVVFVISKIGFTTKNIQLGSTQGFIAFALLGLSAIVSILYLIG